MMNKKKLLSILLAALIALDVVSFSTVFAYHLSACENNASVSVSEVDTPADSLTEDTVIIPPSFDSGHYIDTPMNRDYTENWLFIRRKKASMDFGDNQDREPMVAENMFPGDVISKTYSVTAKHKYQVDLEFTVQNIVTTPEGDTTPLSDVLMFRVSVNGMTQYDGLLKDFTKLVTRYEQYGVMKEDVTVYTIDVYLPTSVGNDYMLNSLMCDFVWTLYEDDYALGTDIIPIPPDDWPWPDKPPVEPDTPDIPDDTEDEEIEIDEPVEGVTEFEAFDYIPAPCHFTEFAAIMGIILVALVAALVAVRRKEASHD